MESCGAPFPLLTVTWTLLFIMAYSCHSVSSLADQTRGCEREERESPTLFLQVTQHCMERKGNSYTHTKREREQLFTHSVSHNPVLLHG